MEDNTLNSHQFGNGKGAESQLGFLLFLLLLFLLLLDSQLGQQRKSSVSRHRKEIIDRQKVTEEEVIAWGVCKFAREKQTQRRRGRYRSSWARVEWMDGFQRMIRPQTICSCSDSHRRRQAVRSLAYSQRM